MQATAPSAAMTTYLQLIGWTGERAVPTPHAHFVFAARLSSSHSLTRTVGLALSVFFGSLTLQPAEAQWNELVNSV